MLRISVVIPTWNERALIGEVVAHAAAIGDEVVVADGGSPDGTAEAARAAGAIVVLAPRGRGAQLHAGAEAASGDVLLFLHADVRLRGDARGAVERALAHPEVIGGNFLLRFEPATPWARMLSLGNDLRRRWLRIYYGDSAIFLRRSTYRALGGFRPLPILEDFELVKRLERHGRTAYVRDVLAAASARRFARAPVRTLLLWGWIQACYSWLGMRPERLARLYD